jgi:hypothetical protein
MQVVAGVSLRDDLHAVLFREFMDDRPDPLLMFDKGPFPGGFRRSQYQMNRVFCREGSRAFSAFSFGQQRSAVSFFFFFEERELLHVNEGMISCWISQFVACELRESGRRVDFPSMRPAFLAAVRAARAKF